MKSNDDPAAASSAGPRLQLLGTPALCLPDGRRRALSTNDAALFALLALRGPLARAWLAALLWPDTPSPKALTALRQRGAKLQQATGCAWLAGQGPLLALASGIGHDLGDPAAALRGDAGAAADPLLGGQVYKAQPELAAAIDAERARWQAQVRAALAQAAEAHQAAHRYEAALACALRLVQADPLHEHAVRLLMRIHHQRGDRGAALQAFERCKRVLYEELGDGPADDTVALALDISRQGAPSAQALARGLHGLTGAIGPMGPMGPPGLALAQPPRTVGREALLASAEWARDAVGAVLLTGAAGIGKTRVFDELVRRWQVPVVCRLQEGHQHADLALLGRLAAALLPCLAGAGADPSPNDPAMATLQATLHWLAQPREASRPPPVPMQRERLALLLAAALKAATRAGVHTVAIDDLHWADADSLALLGPHFSDARGAAAPAGPAGPSGATAPSAPRWLLTSRDAPLPAVLADWLRQAPESAHPQLEVAPLGHADVAELLASMGAAPPDPARWAAALHAHCGGHPMSLIHVLRALNQSGALAQAEPPAQLPVPQDVLRRSARALDRGAAPAQQLAFIMALAGIDFSPDLATRLMACTSAELAVPWRQLKALGILHGSSFSHELMRQAVLEAVPAELAPGIHRDIAQALAASGGAPASLARHWAAAGAWQPAAEASTQAADAAWAVGLNDSARQRWLHAAQWFDRAGQQAAAFSARWQAGARTRNCVSPPQATALAAELLAQAQGPHQKARALCLLSEAEAEEHHVAALPHAREALTLATALDDPALMALARLREAAALRVTGQWPEGLALLTSLLTSLQRQPLVLPEPERAECDLLHASLLSSCGQRTLAVDRWIAMFDAALARRDLLKASELASYASNQMGTLGRVSEALALAEQGRQLSIQAGYDPSHLWVDDLNIAAVCADLGHYRRAIDTGEAAAAGLRAAGSWGWMISVENLLAQVFTILGRLDLAAKRLAAPPPEAPTWAQAMRCAAQARLAQARGQTPLPGLQRAAALLQAGGAIVSPDVQQRVTLELARWGPAENAARQAADSLAWARSNEHVALAQAAGLVAVEAALRLGDPAAAAAAASSAWAALGAPHGGGAGPTPEAYNQSLPELWWAWCRAWDAAGQPQRASAIARHAAGWIDDRMQHHMPDVFKGSFLERNGHVRGLLARAREPTGEG